MSRRTLETEDDIITAGEALFMFRDLRQEVTVLAQLDHPYIVALLGKPRMCVVIVGFAYICACVLLATVCFNYS